MHSPAAWSRDEHWCSTSREDPFSQERKQTHWMLETTTEIPPFLFIPLKVVRTMMIMDAPYAYQTLQPSRGIRLLRLLPSTDVTASLQGSLIEYSLEEMYTEASSYHALSYVWGDPETNQAMTIDGLKLPITANLQVALMHLRHRHVERLLWVDQLCIDQNNEKEKEDQINLMSQIYAGADCVTVWLGAGNNDSDCAIEELRTIGRERCTRSKEEHVVSDQVSHLLQRPWFRRIWEVGVARRVEIRCGHSVIDGHAFALAAEVLKPISETCGEEQALYNRTQSAAFLMKQSIFRPLYHGPPTATGGICTFGELVDMFHSREATKSHDKIYALLGLTSTDMHGSDLLPDYTVPFGQLFERLIKFIISNQLTVECQDDKEAAVLKGRGRVLGTVTRVEDGILNEHEKRVVVRWRDSLLTNSRYTHDLENPWDLRIPAIPIREGDIIILLQGAAEPSIIRVYEDFSIVIVAVAMLRSAAGKDRPWLPPLENSAQVHVPKRDFVLIWDWRYSLESYSNLGRYATWAESKTWISTGSKLVGADHLDALTRLWECAAIKLEGVTHPASRKYSAVSEREVEGILSKRDLHTKGGEHLVASIFDMIGESPTVFCTRSWQHVSFREAVSIWFITYLFHLAIQECHNDVVDLLLATGYVDHNLRVYRVSCVKEFEGLLKSNGTEGYLLKPKSMTPFRAIAWNSRTHGLHGMTAPQAAAKAGSLAVAERLLEMGSDINAPADFDRETTALQAVAKTSDMAIVDRLLQHNADVDAEGAEYAGRTALQTAANAGQATIVQRLYADINNATAIQWSGRAALQAAAEAGNLQIVKLLLEHKADINAPAAEYHGRTALQAAAEGGYLQIVELLLKHKADINAPNARRHGRTALQAAAKGGHLQIVEWLLKHKADVNAPAAEYHGRTALQAAAEAGNLQIVKLLLEHKADINAPAAKDSGRTALQAAAEAGYLPIIELLLKYKADINAPAAEEYGRTALQAAAEGGYLQIVELLLKHKADVNAPASGWRGRTALQAATEQGHLAVVERLKRAGATTV